jgi:hypothetical protein
LIQNSAPFALAPRPTTKYHDLAPGIEPGRSTTSNDCGEKFPYIGSRFLAGKMGSYQNNTKASRALEDESDVEEEALVADYREQVQYEDGMDDMEAGMGSMSMAQHADDIQARLVAAAQPLEFSAPLEAKFQSYDSYCSLFHFILNSDGPVDLEPPSVSPP